MAHEMLWKDVMLDLISTTTCHGCGCMKHFVHNYTGTHCCKGCWRTVYEEESETGEGVPCPLGGLEKGCRYCLGIIPTLANSSHIRSLYGLNPMGKGTRVADTP